MSYYIREKNFIVIILLLIIPLSSFNDKDSIDTISFKLEKRSLNKGRLTVTVSESYFRLHKDTVIKNFIKPEGRLDIISKNGEVATYDKTKNEAYFEQYPGYNTENNIILFFLSTLFNDLNDKDSEFKENANNDRILTKKIKPGFSEHLFNHVNVNYKNQLPFYAEFYDTDENLFLKIYFTDYKFFSEVSIPGTIREFVYINKNDSIINLVNLTDIQINESPGDDNYFDFKIPEDARILE